MPNLTNPFVGYTDRSFEQIMDAILAKLPSQMPEVTDYTPGNPLIRGAHVYASVAEVEHLYIDDAAKQAFLATCDEFPAGVKISRQYDYRVKGGLGATVQLRFYFATAPATDVLIPAGTEAQTNEGVRFFTAAPATIPAGQTEVLVDAQQLVPLAGQQIGVSDGGNGQEFEIDARVAHDSVSIDINGQAWTRQDTLAFSISTDRHFINGLVESGKLAVEFGDGISGAVPGAGLAVVASYYLTDGTAGNVAENRITNLISTVTVPAGLTLRVTNPGRASGGSDPETLADIKKRVPLFIRTLHRAVTRQDHKDVAMLYPSVAKAEVDFTCGKTVDVYIAPQGGGIATDLLTANVVASFEDKRMVTTLVRCLAAGEVHFLMEWDVRVREGFNQAVTGALVRANLAAFMSVAAQEIGGEVQIGDLYEVVETTGGVRHSKLKLIVPVPYARLASGAVEMVWTRVISPASATAKKWRLTMIGGGSFDLIRDGSYMGTFAVGVALSFPELDMTVLPAAYAGNEVYEFWTYPYNESVALTEMSVPVSAPADITLNLTGGI